ncbi:hypothetical protein FB468_2915 [Leucobacter komagatae]|uniref:DUF3060 family protein n=1 Tax=Leucobacter komagatae TaxID=55969 RepID=A0A542YA54_9MICO|nr:hypothetical protein [Leucobacter komagatae]TQL44844.1 hypothetical protein FB468_2915 [Leucobacter komagatae]
MKKTTALTALAGASIALLALTGCTTGDSAGGDAKDDKGSEQKKEETFVPKEVTLECEDGKATAAESNSIFTLSGDCAAVEVTGVNSLVSIDGAVENLTVGGSINKVVVTSAGAITFVTDSSGNVVETAGEPEVTDEGDQNEVVAPE